MTEREQERARDERMGFATSYSCHLEPVLAPGIGLRGGGARARSHRMPTGVATGPPLLEFSSRDGSLWVNGAPLILKGINWYGFETEQGAVHGLYAQPISYFMELLSSNEFNAVRLPLAASIVSSLINAQLDACRLWS